MKFWRLAAYFLFLWWNFPTLQHQKLISRRIHVISWHIQLLIKMHNNYTDNTEYECCSLILPGNESLGALFIGDFNSATDFQLLKKHKIKTIITAAAGMEQLKIPNTITHIIYPLFDKKSENIRRFFDDCNKTIETNLRNGSMLIHCTAGISRSATLVIAYIMKSRKLGFRDAITIVRKRRKNVLPNLGFEIQLKKYEKELFQVPNNAEEKLVEEERYEKRTATIQSGNLKKSKILNNNYIRFAPKTAEETMRRKIKVSGKLVRHYNFSQNRPRQRKIKTKKEQEDGLHIEGHNANQPLNVKIRVNNKINPPLVQSYHRNALKGGWGLNNRH